MGLAVGIVISYMAKEELKPGKRYFIMAHNIILAFILFFILEFLNANVYLTLFFPLIFVIFLFYYSEIYKKSYVLYPILGTFFYIVSKNPKMLLLMSTLIFFYGFLIGSLQIDLKSKNYFKIILQNVLFFICLYFFI
jgi:hypothetical protein